MVGNGHPWVFAGSKYICINFSLHKLYTLVTQVLIINGGFKGVQTKNVDLPLISLDYLVLNLMIEIWSVAFMIEMSVCIPVMNLIIQG